MKNNINYGSTNNNLENGNSELNTQITNSNSIIENINPKVRWNALKNLVKHGIIFGGITVVASLTDAIIENELTGEKFDGFINFWQLDRIKNAILWGGAAITFSICVDKTTFKWLDEIEKDIKELWTGKKILSHDQRIKELEKANLEQYKTILEIKEILESQNKVGEIIYNNNTPWSERMRAQSITTADDSESIVATKINAHQL